MGDGGRYPEKRLQLAALGWLAGTGRYRETFSDIEAKGARMDSVGVLDGRAFAIEVKPSVSAPMVRFHPDGGNSLEAKVATTLRSLREPFPDWLCAFRTDWDPASFPVMAILAGSYTVDGLAELRTMLGERSAEWEFSFEIWRWDGERIEVLASNVGENAGRRRSARVDIPELVGRQARNPPRTLAELRVIASGSGLGPTFEAFVDGAAARGLTAVPQRRGMSLTHRAAGAQRLTVFVDGAGPMGLNVGVDSEWLGMAAAGLPGSEAPSGGYGFMNANRHIRTPDEAEALLDLVAERLGLSAPAARR